MWKYTHIYLYLIFEYYYLMDKNKKIEDLLKTDVKTIENFNHVFFPTLALEIAFKKGLKVDSEIVRIIIDDLENNMEGNYLRWSEEYPVDYDSTIAARNVLSYLDKDSELPINLFFDEKTNLVHTYFGGILSKHNNSIDLIVNLRILDYLVKKETQKEDEKRILLGLENRIRDLEGSVKNVSKYYLSEGFFLWTLSPFGNALGIDVQKKAIEASNRSYNKIDLGLLYLASGDNNILDKYEVGTFDSLDLFWHPRLNKKFSCPFFDYVVKESVELKK